MKPRNKEKLYMYERDNRVCFHCGKRLKFRQMTVDHFLPLSKGGTNDIFNIVTCCKKCNRSKADDLPARLEETVLELFMQAVNDDMIIGYNLNIDNRELKERLLEVERIEDITDKFVFQSSSMRFYIEDNLVTKVVHIGGNNEYNYNFSWED